MRCSKLARLFLAAFFLTLPNFSFSQQTASSPPATPNQNPPSEASSATRPPLSEQAQEDLHHHFNMMQMLEQIPPYRPNDGLEGKLTIAGSTTMSDLGHFWAVNFKQFHPKVELTGAPTGSEAALKQLADDPSMIVGVSRPVDESDQAKLKAGKCKDPVAIVVGIEAMAFIVHKDNPLEAINLETLKAIYLAGDNDQPRAKVWGDVGVQGPLASEPIVIHERDAESGTQVFLSRIVLGGAKMVPASVICESNSKVCDAVGNNKLAIGLVDIHAENPNIRRVPLAVSGSLVEANDEHVLEGRYPLIRPLMIVFDKSEKGQIGSVRESLLRYVLSRDGQTVVMKAGFFPLEPSLIQHQLNEVFGQQLR